MPRISPQKLLEQVLTLALISSYHLAIRSDLCIIPNYIWLIYFIIATICPISCILYELSLSMHYVARPSVIHRLHHPKHLKLLSSSASHTSNQLSLLLLLLLIILIHVWCCNYLSCLYKVVEVSP